MKSTNLWIYLYIKPELVINTFLDRTLAEVNAVTVFGLESVVNQLKDRKFFMYYLNSRKCGEDGGLGVVIL